MNSLKGELSPFLTVFKDSPVNWHSWDMETFKEAREKNKPILLVIGHASSHINCIMNESLFEKSEIFNVMNEKFINVLLDSEERPEIDGIYSAFLRNTINTARSPKVIFLTPSLVPFLGESFFGKEIIESDSFSRMMDESLKMYLDKKSVIENEGISKTDELQGVSIDTMKKSLFRQSDFDRMAHKISQLFDKQNGGFTQEPKYNNALPLLFLLNYYVKTKHGGILEMIEHTLQMMATGGIYDHIGGGFHSFSADREWKVPAFQKTLYDNALLSTLYLRTYQVKKDPFYLEIAEETLNFVLDNMKDVSEGFFSSLDADVDGVEGKYYLWSAKEMEEILTKEEFEIAKFTFDITEKGDFNGMNVLTTNKPVKDIALKFKMKEQDLNVILKSIKNKMSGVRDNRDFPETDRNIIAGWNGLIISSLALAYSITRNMKYLDAAIHCAVFIWNKCFINGELFHSFRDGNIQVKGFSDDYGLIAESFVQLYEATYDETWLSKAKTICDVMIKNFYDEKNSTFYYSPQIKEDMIRVPKGVFDILVPGGNSTCVSVLLKMSKYINDEKYLEIAQNVIQNYYSLIIEKPMKMGNFLNAAYYEFSNHPAIVIIARSIDIRQDIDKKIASVYIPFTEYLIRLYDEPSEIEIVQDKLLTHGDYQVYSCGSENKKVKTISSLVKLSNYLIRMKRP